MSENDFLSRTRMLIGDSAAERLLCAKVAVFGLGGVGSYTAEALARSGVGTIHLIDADAVEISNINRQLYALCSTVGKYKADVAKDRISDINPGCRTEAFKIFYDAETANEFDFSGYDYIADCIDSVASKLLLIQNAAACRTPVISCMGTGNKLNPMGFIAVDIYETSVCPLARVMRRELKARGIKKLRVVYSREQPSRTSPAGRTPASCSFVPGAAGLLIASEIVKGIIGSN